MGALELTELPALCGGGYVRHAAVWLRTWSPIRIILEKSLSDLVSVGNPSAGITLIKESKCES